MISLSLYLSFSMSLSAWKGVGQGKGESSKVGGALCAHELLLVGLLLSGLVPPLFFGSSFSFCFCYFLVLPLPLPLASCCESFFRRLEEEEEEEEEKETTVFGENDTISCRQITMRLSSCFLPCEKGVIPVYHARNTFLLAFVSQQTSNFA